MSNRPYVVSEATWSTVRATGYQVAVLPWGATEAHNLHLPYGTDNVESERIAIESARVAWDKGVRTAVLPCVPYGVNTGQLNIPLCINMNPSTQAALLADVAASLEGHGVQKLVILNGHGGNDFRQMIRELQPRTPVFLCSINWWQIVPAADYFAEPGDHAGELETSVMQHLAPGLVRSLSEAGDGAARQSRIAAFREGWAWAPRPWTQVSRDTGIGNPAAATAAKGEKYVAAVTTRIAEFLVELAAADTAALYE